MSLARSNTFGTELAKVLGLSTDRLCSFSVHIAPDRLVEIRATYHAETVVEGALAQFERRFTLQDMDPT